MSQIRASTQAQKAVVLYENHPVCRLAIAADHRALDLNHPSYILKYLVAMLSLIVVLFTLSTRG